MFENLTVVIATKNRHLYLERIIDYYSDSGINILVADATKEKYRKELPTNITYYHYPEVPYCSKLNDVFSKINTPYAMLCADDDFIIPKAISTCVEFLEKNPDYYSAQGNYVFFYHSRNKLFYSPGYLSTIDCDFREDKATERLNKFNHTGIQFYYCVHKTETLKEVFSFASAQIQNLNFVELLIGMITLINGKHKVLPVFYSARETLYGSAGRSHGLVEFSTSPEFKEQYDAFFSEISRLISIQENINIDQATSFLKQFVQNHIGNRYNNKFSLKKEIIRLSKKTLPFKVRKGIRHYSLLFQESKKQKANMELSLKADGFPFKSDTPETKELKKIEHYIMKYNIHQ